MPLNFSLPVGVDKNVLCGQRFSLRELRNYLQKNCSERSKYVTVAIGVEILLWTRVVARYDYEQSDDVTNMVLHSSGRS